MTSISSPQLDRLWEVTSRSSSTPPSARPCTGSCSSSRSRCPVPTTSASGRPSPSCRSSATPSGPIVGFFTGFVGNAIGDQISGWGVLTSWNWSLANGLVGLIAGLAPLYLARLMVTARSANRAIGGAIAGVDRGGRRVPVRLHRHGPAAARLQHGPDDRATSRSIIARPHRDDHPGPDPRLRLGAGQGAAGPLAAAAHGRGPMNFAPRYLGRGSWLARRDPRVLVLVVFFFVFTVDPDLGPAGRSSSCWSLALVYYRSAAIPLRAVRGKWAVRPLLRRACWCSVNTLITGGRRASDIPDDQLARLSSTCRSSARRSRPSP